jgi:hypothetical protein
VEVHDLALEPRVVRVARVIDVAVVDGGPTIPPLQQVLHQRTELLPLVRIVDDAAAAAAAARAVLLPKAEQCIAQRLRQPVVGARGVTEGAGEGRVELGCAFR